MTEVVTGEAVVLDVPCARFPSRIAALLVDLLIQVALLVIVLIAIFASAGQLDGAWSAGIFLTAYVLIVVGYATVFETLSRGKTVGKLAFGLRVISDDGGPVRFRQALVRALTGAIEIWILIGAPIGLITSIVSAKGKRLGDMFAGTYVISERVPQRPDLLPEFTAVPPPLLGWAQVAETSRLSDESAEAAGSYLRRFHELTPPARADLGLRIAGSVAAQVSPPPPPGTPPWAFLSAVLAVRRQREQAWLASRQPPPAASAPPGHAGAAPVPATRPAAGPTRGTDSSPEAGSPTAGSPTAGSPAAGSPQAASPVAGGPSPQDAGDGWFTPPA